MAHERGGVLPRVIWLKRSVQQSMYHPSVVILMKSRRINSDVREALRQQRSWYMIRIGWPCQAIQGVNIVICELEGTQVGDRTSSTARCTCGSREGVWRKLSVERFEKRRLDVVGNARGPGVTYGRFLISNVRKMIVSLTSVVIRRLVPMSGALAF